MHYFCFSGRSSILRSIVVNVTQFFRAISRFLVESFDLNGLVAGTLEGIESFSENLVKVSAHWLIQ